jgi:phage RecT family recombinase
MSNIVPTKGFKVDFGKADAVVAEQYCTLYEDRIKKALAYELISGPSLAYEPLVAAVMEDVANSQKLGQAIRESPQSFISCLMMAAQCKLLPGGKYDLFYMIPRRMSRKTADGWSKVMEVTPLIGYKGLSHMAQQHPRVHSVEAFCVFKGEKFSFSPGTGVLVHDWDPDVSREDDDLVAAYAKAIICPPNDVTPNPTPIVWPLSVKQIHKSRDRSEAYKGAEKYGKADSPWHTDYLAMCRKTAIRGMLTNGSIPRDMGIGGMISQEDRSTVDRGESAPLPKADRTGSLRQSLGLDTPPPDFGTAEEAVAHIEAAADIAALEHLRGGFSSFKGIDTSTISEAYTKRESELTNDGQE